MFLCSWSQNPMFPNRVEICTLHKTWFVDVVRHCIQAVFCKRQPVFEGTVLGSATLWACVHSTCYISTQNSLYFYPDRLKYSALETLMPVSTHKLGTINPLPLAVFYKNRLFGNIGSTGKNLMKILGRLTTPRGLFGFL